MEYNPKNYPNTAVHCPTQELAKQVCEIANVPEKFYKKYFKLYDDYCIKINENFSYGDIEHYTENNFKIIKAEEFIKLHSESEIVENFEVY